MMNMNEFADKMTSHGFAVFANAVPAEMVKRMLSAIHDAYNQCRAIQVANGIGEGTENTVHHLPSFVRQRIWIDYLESMAVAPYLEQFLGGKIVLNSFGGNLNPPSTTNYAAAIHRDIRSWSPDRLMVNTLVALDEFNERNGATWLMPGSQHQPDKPDEATFSKTAIQTVMPAGSVLVFDARVWHRAGRNNSTSPRRIVTPIFARPFYRPEFDYPRALGGGDGSQFPDGLRQILGFRSRVPSKLTEFYRPQAERFYGGD